jgi:hypothetical protein
VKHGHRFIKGGEIELIESPVGTILVRADQDANLKKRRMRSGRHDGANRGEHF